MSEALKNALEQPELPWRQRVSCVPWEPDSPHPQPMFGFDGTTHNWEEIGTYPPQSQSEAIHEFLEHPLHAPPPTRARMEAALAELQTHIAALPEHRAAMVFLQECVPQDLETIGETAWVRAGFLRTDVDSPHWASRSYGTTTLVDRRLGVVGCFRVHYALTDMGLRRKSVLLAVLDQGGKIVRFCNTHLESLAHEPSFCPPQIALAAKFMHEDGRGFERHPPVGRTLHSDNDLRDAYLELGGQENSEEGYTWGQQAAPELRNMHGCSRMDKIFYCGGVSVQSFSRFGADVEVAEEGERERIMRFEKAWITDHLGIFAEITVLD
ncbi:hypothetical protein RRF57_002698 [Xylaria bambusicola]|uniref:Uncharacterized protein n=1 Tax=Xylaria bambusicola TaxID=326684 RepID=A0AAN7UFN2_9PEZI